MVVIDLINFYKLSSLKKINKLFVYHEEQDVFYWYVLFKLYKIE
jgi:hypothetical protein